MAPTINVSRIVIVNKPRAYRAGLTYKKVRVVRRVTAHSVFMSIIDHDIPAAITCMCIACSSRVWITAHRTCLFTSPGSVILSIASSTAEVGGPPLQSEGEGYEALFDEKELERLKKIEDESWTRSGMPRVLVHCEKGYSRLPMVLIAYLMMRCQRRRMLDICEGKERGWTNWG